MICIYIAVPLFKKWGDCKSAAALCPRPAEGSATTAPQRAPAADGCSGAAAKQPVAPGTSQGARSANRFVHRSRIRFLLAGIHVGSLHLCQHLRAHFTQENLGSEMRTTSRLRLVRGPKKGDGKSERPQSIPESAIFIELHMQGSGNM